jgi:glycosyltransferase involved in cell wall biosynthesis
MRIALISSDALPTPPPRYGGLEQVVYLLARELARMGHTVTVYALEGSQPPPGVCFVPFRSVWDCWQYEEQILEHDVIHGHDWQKFVWQLAEKHPKRQFVQTWHGHRIGHDRPAANVTVAGVSRWNAFVLSAETGVLCPHVYNGIDLDEYPLHAGQREDYVLCMNRLDPAKGLHLAVELAKMHGFRLKACGTEHLVPDREYVQAVLTRMDGKQLCYLGDLGMELKVNCLQRAQCLLWFCPWPEPFGLGAIEAMACGTPVVALAWGGVTETVQQGGVLVTHPEEVPAAIRRASAIPPEICRRNAWRFSARAMAESYVGLYNSLISGRRGVTAYASGAMV